MRNLILFLLFSLALTSTRISAQSKTIVIKGSVFVDTNGNGLRDANENGLKDVVVTDQVSTVKTDAAGFYTLGGNGGLGFVLISQPDGFTVKGSFWKAIPEGQNEFTADFALIRSTKPAKFTFVHASDTHISESSLPRTEKLRALVDSLKPAFILITGDLIKDALRVPEKEATAQYELYVREISKFKMPVWSVPGNHEIFGIERQFSLVSKTHPRYGKKMYRSYLGPDYYSFNYGGVHFVGLNSVDHTDLWYYGHVDSLQFSWLEKDLASVSNKTPVVTFNHIPFYSGGHSMWLFEEDGASSVIVNENGKKVYRHVVDNAAAIFTLLNGYNFSMALSGHYHASEQFTIDTDKKKVKLYQTGAVVGPSQSGSMTMPSGITLYTVEDGKIDDGKFIRLK